jgi:hypothetical protein
MNPRGAVLHSIVLCAISAALFLAGLPAQATSIVFSTFSAPVFQEDRLVFTSPDGKRLLCASLEGKIVWERKFERPIVLFTGAESEAVVQVGKVVSAVSMQSGELRAEFTVEDENDAVSFSPELGSYVSRDRRFEKRLFKLLDGQTGKPLWRTSEIENIVCATPELMVCLAAERIPTRDGFRFGKASLDAYDRKSFARAWSVPLADRSGGGFLDAAFKAPFLVYSEARTSLVVLDCATGRKQVTKQMEVPEGSWMSGVSIHGEHLVWLTHKIDHDDFNNSQHLLHFCTLSDLREVKKVVLKLIEIASVSFEGEFMIADSLYRTACFRLSGEKVWERFQCARTEVIKDRIYFSDQSKNTARLGFIEVATGKETILYTERLPEPKK